MTHPIYQSVDTVPYGAELVEILDVLKGIPGYPARCELPSTICEELLGLKGVEATCNLSRHRTGKFGQTHFTGLDEVREVYVDLALYQFSEENFEPGDDWMGPSPEFEPYAKDIPEIAIFPVKSKILVPVHSLVDSRQRAYVDSETIEILRSFPEASRCAQIVSNIDIMPGTPFFGREIFHIEPTRASLSAALSRRP